MWKKKIGFSFLIFKIPLWVYIVKEIDWNKPHQDIINTYPYICRFIISVYKDTTIEDHYLTIEYENKNNCKNKKNIAIGILRYSPSYQFPTRYPTCTRFKTLFSWDTIQTRPRISLSKGLLCLYILRKWRLGRVTPIPHSHIDNRIQCYSACLKYKV